MEWVETTGRTIEEAKEGALDQLGVDEADAEFEIVEEPKSGLFGRLRAQARVRARIRPATPRAKEDRRDRRRRDRARSASQSDDGAPARAPASEGEDGPMSDVSLQDQAEVARSFLAGLVQSFGVHADIVVQPESDDTVEVCLTGKDLGRLIGPKGATLAAVQELARTVVQRQTGARTGWVVVDVAGYRRRRREALEAFTREVTSQVVASGTRRVLEPMSALDRKTVHDVANTIDGVRTLSEGEDPHRRVVILPSE
ncbi:MAG: RNA-binding cell elongation regulator Jag/EloR [Acidimicrobiales bacterium]